MKKRYFIPVSFIILLFIGYGVWDAIRVAEHNQQSERDAILIEQIQGDEIPIYTTIQIVTGDAQPGSVVYVSGTILTRNGDDAFINTWRPGMMRVITVDVNNMPTGTGYYPDDSVSFYGLYQERQDNGDIIIRYLTR